jgi:bifunctional non-homologous end joining protein LigD
MSTVYPAGVGATPSGYNRQVSSSQTIDADVDGRTVRLTSLDRVLWPETGATKGWLLHAYSSLAPVLLPHLGGHPITMWRYPEGVHREGWWQNECRGAPPWVNEYRYTAKDGREHRHCVIDDLSSLLWLVNLGTVEIHPFPFTVEAPDEPTWQVFDLDPGEPATIRDACRVASRLYEALTTQGLQAFPKTSGAKGIHVFVPLNGGADFETTKAYARTVAAFLARERPDLVVDRQDRRLRSGKVLVDWLQNDRFRSTVAPYSLRATQEATVSAPVTWEEIRAVAEDDVPEDALAFGVDDVLARLEASGDPFRRVLELRQELRSTTAD